MERDEDGVYNFGSNQRYYRWRRFRLRTTNTVWSRDDECADAWTTHGIATWTENGWVELFPGATDWLPSRTEEELIELAIAFLEED